MKTSTFLPVIILSFILLSCDEKGSYEQASTSEEMGMVNSEEIQSDFRQWWTYHATNIELMSNFIGLDEDLDTIPKKLFLEQLIKESYIPLLVNSDKGTPSYQLLKLGDKADVNIKSTIKNEALTSLKYYEMEGTSFPKFKLTDLNGNTYSSESTKGKFLVVKTWFIGCTACILEFPELNEFVEKYSDRDDILFLSLATDSALELEKFLKKKHFKYLVVPDQEDLIVQKLGFSIYQTHLVIDKTGKITKVVNKASTLISYIDSQMK